MGICPWKGLKRGGKALQPRGPWGPRCGPWASPGCAQADGAPASRPRLSRQAVSWNRILGLDRAASAIAACSHGPASGAAEVHLVRLHRPGRGEERQGLQIPAQSESSGRAGTAPARGWWVGCEGQSGFRDAWRPPGASTEGLLNIKINKSLLSPSRWFWGSSLALTRLPLKKKLGELMVERIF